MMNSSIEQNSYVSGLDMSLQLSPRLSQRILLIDFHIARRSVIEWLLKEEKHEVVHASSLWEAYEKFEHQLFHLVISVHQPPRLNGLDLLERIKQVDPSLPVLLVSPDGDAETERSAIDQGALDCLYKPIDYSYLQKIIHSLSLKKISEQDRNSLRRSQFKGVYQPHRIDED